jgi:putative spermidine/putrescine transport system ATP-binding protein
MGYRNVLDLDVVSEDGERVTVSGSDIRLTGTRKLPLQGKRAALAFRPEEATLADPGLATNAIAGQVANVEYGGRDSLVDVKTPAGTVLHVRSARQPALGDRVAVHVPVERALVYPAE